MASTFRKDKLEETINALGIDVDENIEWNNEKMVKCLGDYYMSLEPEKYTWGARYIQSLNTVMLCKHLKEELKKFGDDNPAESPNYTAEVKLNGFRALLSYSPKDGFEFFSRNESISNYLNGNFTNKYLMFNKGIITEPKDYIGRFDYRFVLDGELLVERTDGANVVEGVSVEDYIQSILGSSEERAKSFQKEECKLLFNVFDILYFEPHPNPNPPMPQYNYYEPEFTPELVEWVEAHYSDYLEEAHFEKGGKKSKILYQYLYTLKGTSKYDIRRLPFIKRRELRHKIVSFLQKEGVPFKEIEWEDTYKVAFTDNILREGGEGCFSPSTKVNMADGTLKPIKSIKEGDIVLSYNIQNKCFEGKKVSKVIYNGQKDISNYISVSHGAFQTPTVANKQNRYHRIKCTLNHNFYNGDTYTPIANLNYVYEISNKMDHYRTQALYGWLLSDGYMDKNGIISLSQKESSPFWAFTKEMFKEFTTKGHSRVIISGKGSRIGRLTINKEYCVPFWKFKNDKVSMVQHMDEIGIAYLIMGDGSRSKKAIEVSTESLPLEVIQALMNQIDNIIGEKGSYSLKEDKRVKTYGYRLRILTNTSKKLKDKISKYIHESMRYKLGDSYTKDTFVSYPPVEKCIKKVPIKKTPISEYQYDGKRKTMGAWDLEVEDNHNYFVESVLVHNSILKAIHAPYISALRTNRGHRAAMKVKQNIASMLSGDMGEVSDFDVFITGANPPKSDRITDMIGALRCSIYIKEEDGTTHEHEIACVSGIPHEWKRKLAQIDVNTGKIGLNPEYLGKVIPINGLALTKGNLKFQHATLLNKGEMGFKAKHPTECTWDRSVLDDMVLVRGK